MLSRRGVAFTTRDLFKAPLSAAEIRALAARAPGGVRDLLSTRSTQYRAKEPRLLRRPLVDAGSRLVVGFDREALEALR